MTSRSRVENLPADGAFFIGIPNVFRVQATMFRSREQLQISNVIVRFVVVDVVNFVIAFGNIAVVILPNVTMDELAADEMPFGFCAINKTKKFLVCVVDLFNDGRRG